MKAKKKNGRHVVAADIKGLRRICLKKWAEGQCGISLFKDKGNVLDNDCFEIKHDGYYTVYAQDSDGAEAVKVINVGRNMLIPFMFLPMIALIIIALILIMNKPVVALRKPHRPIGGIKDVSVSSILQKDQLMITDTVNSSATFVNGKAGTGGSWYFANKNTNKVIMQAQIFVNNKPVATSVELRPGQESKSIALQCDIEKGQYTAMAYINYYDLHTQNYISKAAYKISLIVY